MKTVRRYTTLAMGILLLVGISHPLRAQERGPDPAKGIEESLTTRAATLESERERVLDFLNREAVRTTAEKHGIDLEEVRAAVQTMEAQELKGLEKQMQTMDDAMAGGDRIVIASSTIIIILLILILVAVA